MPFFVVSFIGFKQRTIFFLKYFFSIPEIWFDFVLWLEKVENIEVTLKKYVKIIK